ncbi:MAG TPA: hypothetical protein VJQ09_07720 [Candidatus Limnocylindria bacterium]|nr:hypothetical protein [Candidatus Limnocylindria bacterium]
MTGIMHTFDGVAGRIDAIGARSLGFTSAVAGEGVTTVALGTAMALAAIRDDGVLLVDANWLSPALTADAGLRSHAGLAELLAGTADPGSVIVASRQERLGIVPIGDRGASRPALRSLAALLARDIPGYATVIVDLPPVLAGEAYVLPWTAVLDHLFVVLREGATPLPVARSALERIGIAAPQVILNRAAPTGSALPASLLARVRERA